ncbi:hypothetical protein IP92_02882 [Pseudoduganella flava]|nr:hypothetical protein IP92_02882 [Pseudoduganella flava]
MFVGFATTGIATAVRALHAAPDALQALGQLVALTALASGAAIVVPFAVVATQRVSAFGFCFLTILAVSTVAVAAGALLHERFAATREARHGVFAAACLLGGASFPVTWFAFAHTLERWFHVQWSY